MENNYTVYTHTLPNGKTYVGYINMDSGYVNGSTFDEVMEGGKYHENRGSLYADIQNCGWENVRTEIISGLTKEQAVEKKKALCLEYESYLPALGYNRYADAGLLQPPKVDKTPKGKLAKKIISTFLHGDFSIYNHILKCLDNYTEESIAEMLETAKIEAGYIALSLTRKKFNNPYSEAHYLLEVLCYPHVVI